METDIQTKIAEQEQNLSFAQQNSDQAAQLESWYKLGHLYNDLRDYPQSVHAYEQAAALATQLKDAHFLLILGLSFGVLHEYPQSIDCLKQSIQISLEHEETQHDALRVIRVLASQYKDFLQDIPQAITFYQKGLELSQKTNDKKHQYWNLRELGSCAEKLDELQHAIDYYEQALLVVRQDGDKSEEVTLLTNIAMVFAKLNDHVQMSNRFEQALRVAQNSDDPSDEIGVLIWWGHAYRQYGNLPETMHYYQRALALATTNNDINNISICLTNLATLSHKQGNLQDAIALYQQEVQTLHEERLKSVNNHQAGFLHFSYTNALESLGKLYEEMNDVPQALNYMEQALASETIRSSVLDLNDHITRLRQKLTPTTTNDEAGSQ